MDAQTVLTTAADSIASKGLWKNDGHAASGLCTVVAVHFASDGDTLAEWAAIDAVRGYLGFTELAQVFAWNDDPARTSGEVSAMLRAVADIESQVADIIDAARALPVVVL